MLKCGRLSCVLECSNPLSSSALVNSRGAIFSDAHWTLFSSRQSFSYLLNVGPRLHSRLCGIIVQRQRLETGTVLGRLFGIAQIFSLSISTTTSTKLSWSAARVLKKVPHSVVITRWFQIYNRSLVFVLVVSQNSKADIIRECQACNRSLVVVVHRDVVSAEHLLSTNVVETQRVCTITEGATERFLSSACTSGILL